jgi:hypothetical protein
MNQFIYLYCTFCGVINQINEITPLGSYLDFPFGRFQRGNILDPAMQPTSATKQYVKSVLCLFVPFRDETLFTEPQTMALSYTKQLQVVMESGKINKTMQRRLQNIQD